LIIHRRISRAGSVQHRPSMHHLHHTATAAAAAAGSGSSGPPHDPALVVLDAYRSPVLVSRASAAGESRFIKFGNPIADILQACSQQIVQQHASAPPRPTAQQQQQQQQQQQPRSSPLPSPVSRRSYETGTAAGGSSLLQQGQLPSAATFPLNLAVWGGALEGIVHVRGQFPELEELGGGALPPAGTAPEVGAACGAGRRCTLACVCVQLAAGEPYVSACTASPPRGYAS
jgi:hypothetical protein